MPRLNAKIARHFVGRYIRHSTTRNPALCIKTLAGGDQLVVRPNYHKKEETVDTSMYDAFISRNPDLRHLFAESEIEPEDREAPPAAEPEPAEVEPTKPEPGEEDKPAEPNILEALDRVRKITDELSVLRCKVADKEKELRSYQSDMIAIRAMIDEIVGKPQPAAYVAPMREQSERAKEVADWAKKLGRPFAISEVLIASKGMASFAGASEDARRSAMTGLFKKFPFKKVSHGIYTVI